MTKHVTSPYTPRQWAIPFHGTDKRWMILVVHRRAGKTTAAVNFLIRSALTKPNTNYAYIAPTYKMAQNVAWEILKEYAGFVPGIIRRKSELSVTFPSGSKITLYGAENPDRLRGMGLGGVVFDEYGMQPGKIFTEIIRPTLLEKEGYAIWIGTPQGKNEFFHLYEDHKNDDDWFICHLTVDDTKVISEEEIESSKKAMSKEEYMQELYCSFESPMKGAVYAEEIARARESGRIGPIPHRRDQKVHTVWDLGVGQAMAIGFYQNISGMMYMIDYWQGSESEGIDSAVREVYRRKYNYGKHFAPHDINHRELSTGKTRLEYAKDLGIEFNVIDFRTSVQDGIQAGKFLFDRLHIDSEKCEIFLDALGQYRRDWDEDKKMYREIPYHDWTSHAADVHRYAAIVEEKMSWDYDNRFGAITFPYDNPDPFW